MNQELPKDAQYAIDLREIIDGTPFPLYAPHNPDDTIDYVAEVDRWLDHTAAWRAALVRLGLPDTWVGPMQQIRTEALRRVSS